MSENEENNDQRLERLQKQVERMRHDLYGNGEDGLVHEHQGIMRDVYGSDRRGGQTGVVQLLGNMRNDLTTLNQQVQTWAAQIATGLKVAVVLLAGGLILGVVQFIRDLLAGRI